MTDTNALRSIIADSGLKYKAIAEIMGLTPYALQMKIDNETEFKASEDKTMCSYPRPSTLIGKISEYHSDRLNSLIPCFQLFVRSFRRYSPNAHSPSSEESSSRLKVIASLDLLIKQILRTSVYSFSGLGPMQKTF